MIKDCKLVFNLYKKNFFNLLLIPFWYGLIFYNSSTDGELAFSLSFIFLINVRWLTEIYSNKNYTLIISLPLDRTLLFNTLCYLSLLVILSPIIPYIILTLFSNNSSLLLLLSIIVGNLFNFCLFTFAYSKIVIGSSKMVLLILFISLLLFSIVSTLISNGVLSIILCLLVLLVLIPTTYLLSLKLFKSRSIL